MTSEIRVNVSWSRDVYKRQDPTQPVEFALNTLVGGGIEPCRIRKHLGILGDLLQDCSEFAVSGGNQPVHSSLAKLPDRRRQRPPRQESSMRRTSTMPGWP